MILQQKRNVNMKTLECLVLANILVLIECIRPKAVNVALETILEFDKKDNSADVELIDKVQSFLSQVKNAIHKKTRRNMDIEDKTLFIDFLKNALLTLNSYNDDDLEDTVAYFDEELRKYHYKGCKFYELLENFDIRRSVSAKLEELRDAPAKTIRRNIHTFLKELQGNELSAEKKHLMNYLNSLYRSDSKDKIMTLLNNLQLYKSPSKRATNNLNLKKIVRDGVHSLIFDHYTNLNPNARRELKIRLETFWKDLTKPDEIVDRHLWSAGKDLIFKDIFTTSKIETTPDAYRQSRFSQKPHDFLNLRERIQKTTTYKLANINVLNNKMFAQIPLSTVKINLVKVSKINHQKASGQVESVEESIEETITSKPRYIITKDYFKKEKTYNDTRMPSKQHKAKLIEESITQTQRSTIKIKDRLREKRINKNKVTTNFLELSDEPATVQAPRNTLKKKYKTKQTNIRQHPHNQQSKHNEDSSNKLVTSQTPRSKIIKDKVKERKILQYTRNKKFKANEDSINKLIAPQIPHNTYKIKDQTKKPKLRLRPLNGRLKAEEELGNEFVAPQIPHNTHKIKNKIEKPKFNQRALNEELKAEEGSSNELVVHQIPHNTHKINNKIKKPKFNQRALNEELKAEEESSNELVAPQIAHNTPKIKNKTKKPKLSLQSLEGRLKADEESSNELVAPQTTHNIHKIKNKIKKPKLSQHALNEGLKGKEAKEESSNEFVTPQIPHKTLKIKDETKKPKFYQRAVNEELKAEEESNNEFVKPQTLHDAPKIKNKTKKPNLRQHNLNEGLKAEKEPSNEFVAPQIPHNTPKINNKTKKPKLRLQPLNGRLKADEESSNEFVTPQIPHNTLKIKDETEESKLSQHAVNEELKAEEESSNEFVIPQTLHDAPKINNKTKKPKLRQHDLNEGLKAEKEPSNEFVAPQIPHNTGKIKNKTKKSKLRLQPLNGRIKADEESSNELVAPQTPHNILKIKDETEEPKLSQRVLNEEVKAKEKSSNEFITPQIPYNTLKIKDETQESKLSQHAVNEELKAEEESSNEFIAPQIPYNTLKIKHEIKEPKLSQHVLNEGLKAEEESSNEFVTPQIPHNTLKIKDETKKPKFYQRAVNEELKAEEESNNESVIPQTSHDAPKINNKTKKPKSHQHDLNEGLKSEKEPSNEFVAPQINTHKIKDGTDEPELSQLNERLKTEEESSNEFVTTQIPHNTFKIKDETEEPKLGQYALNEEFKAEVESNNEFVNSKIPYNTLKIKYETEGPLKNVKESRDSITTIPIPRSTLEVKDMGRQSIINQLKGVEDYSKEWVSSQIPQHNFKMKDIVKKAKTKQGRFINVERSIEDSKDTKGEKKGNRHILRTKQRYPISTISHRIPLFSLYTESFRNNHREVTENRGYGRKRTIKKLNTETFWKEKQEVVKVDKKKQLKHRLGEEDEDGIPQQPHEIVDVTPYEYTPDIVTISQKRNSYNYRLRATEEDINKGRNRKKHTTKYIATSKLIRNNKNAKYFNGTSSGSENLPSMRKNNANDTSMDNTTVRSETTRTNASEFPGLINNVEMEIDTVDTTAFKTPTSSAINTRNETTKTIKNNEIYRKNEENFVDTYNNNEIVRYWEDDLNISTTEYITIIPTTKMELVENVTTTIITDLTSTSTRTTTYHNTTETESTTSTTQSPVTTTESAMTTTVNAMSTTENAVSTTGTTKLDAIPNNVLRAGDLFNDSIQDIGLSGSNLTKREINYEDVEEPLHKTQKPKTQDDLIKEAFEQVRGKVQNIAESIENTNCSTSNITNEAENFDDYIDAQLNELDDENNRTRRSNDIRVPIGNVNLTATNQVPMDMNTLLESFKNEKRENEDEKSRLAREKAIEDLKKLFISTTTTTTEKIDLSDPFIGLDFMDL